MKRENVERTLLNARIARTEGSFCRVWQDGKWVDKVEKSPNNTLTPAQSAAWDYAHTHAVKDKDGRENFHAIYEAFLAGWKEKEGRK